jgi:hypothetical protein
MRADKAVLDQNGRRASLSVTGQGPITYGCTAREALVWLPGRPRRLVVATCGLDGGARLGQWDGGKGWRCLRRVKNPEGECFRLCGVTADGRSIVYGYDPAVSARRPRGDPLRHRRWLRLPR